MLLVTHQELVLEERVKQHVLDRLNSLTTKYGARVAVKLCYRQHVPEEAAPLRNSCCM